MAQKRKSGEKEKTEKDLLEEISARLNQLVGLVAVQGKSEDDQIRILTELGFDSTTSGSFLGIPPGTIRRRRSQTRR